MEAVKSTTRYSAFGYIDGNRDINDNHVRRLMKSIQSRNLLQLCPIVVDENMNVIDGQHRLAAAEKLKLPIFYVKQPGVRIEDVQTLNSTSRVWSVYQFIDSYVKRGFEEYIKLKEFMDEYEMTISSASFLLRKNQGNKSATLREGTFVIDNMAVATKTAELRADFLPYLESKIGNDRDFIAGLKHVVTKVPGFDEQWMKSNIKTWGEPIQRQASKIGYIRLFEAIYNKGKHAPVRFF